MNLSKRFKLTKKRKNKREIDSEEIKQSKNKITFSDFSNYRKKTKRF